MAAFKKAKGSGYGIELDVQLTKDGVMVVHHDYDLKRTCGVNKKIRLILLIVNYADID